MAVMINDDDDISKLLAFLRARSPAEFHVAIDIAEKLICSIRDYAICNNIRVELCTPDKEKIIVFSAAGAFAGAGIGFLMGSFPGMAIGFGVGCLSGYAGAHVRLVMHPPTNDGGNYIRFATA